jgi:Carboxypeptidase regulatory-like domain
MPRLRSLVFVLLSVVLASSSAFAQRDLGTITGTITDPQGAAVPNARIAIVEDATGLSYEATSGATGEYVRPLLPAGTYTITVTLQGFQKAQQKNVLVTAGDRIGVNIALAVGETTQTLEVNATAPLLQTESPQQGANLNTEEMSDLPLGGQRVFSYLARLSPGVLVAEPGARDANGGGFSANGVRSTGENNFLLNGVDNNVNVIDFINQTSFVIGPSVEAIGEMQVRTNGYNAEYGRAAGGVVDVQLKSGTNQIHGVLFEDLQNTELDANRWENNLAGVGRPILKQNQFGAAIGGPIIKNKLFIFGDYQGTRIATSGGVISNLGYGGFFTIPTPLMVKGNFSELLGKAITGANGTVQTLQGQIYDPTTTTCLSGCLAGSLNGAPGATPVYSRTPYPGNVIQPTEWDQAAAKIMSLYPATNQPYQTGSYFTNDYYKVTPGALTTDQGDGRVDYRFSDKTSVFGSISWSNTEKLSTPPLPGALDGGNFYGNSEQDLGRNAMISLTHVFTPTLISESRVGFSRLVTARTAANASTDEYSAEGIGGFDPTTTLNGGLPQFGLGIYSQIGANDWLPTKEYSNVWDFIQNVSLTRGSHSLKFGAEFRPIHFPFFQVPYPHGELDYSRNQTSYPSTLSDNGVSGALNTDTGNEMASFLLGAINFGQISTTNFISSTKQAYAFYAQDDWKMTSKLTISAGVRYELWSPIGEQFGRQSNFDYSTLTLQIPSGPNQTAALPPNFNSNYTFGGVTYPALFPNVSVCRGCVNSYLIPWDKTDIGPRLGFAYNIFPKTVIRGAYGIFYGGEEQQGGNPNRGESAPFNESPALGYPAGVSEFAPNPLFANGAATGGLTVGFPQTVFTTYPVTSLQFREVAGDFDNPMVQKWNLSVQQQLTSSLALEVGYQGNHSSHQLLQPDFNTCPLYLAPNPALNCNALRPYPDIGSISGTATFGFGNYSALTMKLEKRFSKGLQFLTAYTYGHALSDTGTTLSGSPGEGQLNPEITATAYASAAWDIRHNFTNAVTYDIPFGRGLAYGSNMPTAAQVLLGNWHANTVMTFHTGQPFTVTSSGCDGVEVPECTPIVTGNPYSAPAGGRTPSEWFNTSNFSPPASGTYGSGMLQDAFGPPTRNVDFSLFKDFAMTERIKVQFRGEVFNLANTPQYSFPDNNLGDANFGKITSTTAGSERHFQFSLRLQF